MTKSEKAVIRGLRNSLNSAASPGFKEGDINTWSRWANKMQVVIRTNVDVLDELLDLEATEDKEEGVSL